MRIKRWATLPATIAGTLLLLLAPALAAERVALVVGNANYNEAAARLKNPVNDATAVTAALRRLGFQVIVGTDLSEDSFYGGITAFDEAARTAKIALFFYAGHGLQVDGRNYLAPIDLKLETRQDLKRGAVELADVLEVMRSETNLVILDACRTNPLAGELARSLGLSRAVAANRGLARVESTGDMLIAYATAPDDVAEDGTGDHSPYTAALLEHLETPGLSVNDLFAQVTNSVLAGTGGKQRPWTHASMSRVVRLVPGSAAPVVPRPEVPAAAPVRSPALSPELVEAGLELRRADRRLIQLGLLAAGFDPGKVDGLIGAKTREALRQWQASRGEEATGYLEVEPAKVLLASGEQAAAEAERRRQELEPGRRFRNCDACPEMVVVPAGSYMMGSPVDEEGRRDNEGPQHRVTIAEPFAVGVHEVTRGEFGRFAQETGRSMGTCRIWDRGQDKWVEPQALNWRNPGFEQTDRHPVVCVNWDDAQAYGRWLSRETGERYRLLSESEWEYVARAGSTGPFHTGATISPEQANYNGNHAYGSGRKGVYRERTLPVGSFTPNAYGLHDVHGNVSEWVQDCSNNNYRGAPDSGRTWESGYCSWRIGRGGSWYVRPSALRSAYRSAYSAGFRLNYFGFRIAQTLIP